MSYTFDCQNSGLSHFPIPLSKPYTIMPEGSVNHLAENFSIRNVDGDNSQNLKCRPSRSTYTSSSYGRDRDFSSFTNHRWVEDSVRKNADHRRSDQCQKKESQNQQLRDNTKKSAEAWDSNVNLVSNSNSENDSSVSLNSTSISPNVDVSGTRPTYSSFVRECLMANQRNFTVNTSSPTTSAVSNSIIHSTNEFPGSSNISNNNSINNDNNNNIRNNSVSHSNSHSNNPGFGNNFLSELPDAVSVRSPFGLIAETFLDMNRGRSSTFLNQAILQDSQMPTSSTQPSNETENERHHFRLFDFNDLEPNVDAKKRPRHYYKLHYTPWNFLKIRFDRLELMAILDRNLTVFEIFLSLFLSVAVSVCGIVLLNYGFYRDLFAFLFCFALAGCQYSLIKSVQPDATSPTHGYNRVVIYSRSIYFCVTVLLILLLSAYLDKKSYHFFQFYCFNFNSNIITLLRDGLVNLLLFFPVLFTLGLFPQINTFALYVLEQMDMHIFGGNAMSSLSGATYCIFRSIVTLIFLYGFAYGALSETKGSQHILYSIFCGGLVSLSYHLSRSSSNPNILWGILKNHLFQDELHGKNYSKEHGRKKIKKNEFEKSVDESFKSEVNLKNEDEKSEDKNSQNNLLLNSNPSSNEMLKASDSHSNQKSNLSELYENSGSGSDINSCKKEKQKEEFVDPLPRKLKDTVNSRLKNDAIVCCLVALLVFGIHCSTVFTALQPDLNPVNIFLAI